MSIILDQENFYGKTSVSVVGYASPPGSQPRSQLVKESQYYSGIKMRFIWLKQCNKKKKIISSMILGILISLHLRILASYFLKI